MKDETKKGFKPFKNRSDLPLVKFISLKKSPYLLVPPKCRRGSALVYIIVLIRNDTIITLSDSLSCRRRSSCGKIGQLVNGKDS